MKKMMMILKVEDNFKIGDCENCPMKEYIDDFGELACYEGECIHGNDNCPLTEYKE